MFCNICTQLPLHTRHLQLDTYTITIFWQMLKKNSYGETFSEKKLTSKDQFRPCNISLL